MQDFGIINLGSQNTTYKMLTSGERSSWTFFFFCPSGFKLRFLCLYPIEKKDNAGTWASL